MHGSTQKKDRLIYEEETFAIRGAAFDVYKEMSNGFLESVYQECLEKELTAREIPFVAQPELKLAYKDELLQQAYKPDLICYGKIIVELKAAKDISDEHRAQVINYLKATGLKLGIVVNFGHFPKVQIERFIL
jgi:GxxExxY protein